MFENKQSEIKCRALILFITFTKTLTFMNHLLYLNIGAPVMILVVLFLLVLPLYCLVNILLSDFKDTSTKLLWFLVVIGLPLIGSLLYLKIGKPDKK